jgi:chlorobactene glucosyltransferase
VISWNDPALSNMLAAGYLGLLTILWFLLLLGARGWGRRWPLAQRDGDQVVPPVLVCVPARNEALNIEACVRSVLASKGVDLLLVVLDDSSTDDTGALAQRAAGDDPRVTVRAGQPPPSGWAGKSWALVQASADAERPYLLFLDADVELHPRALYALLAQAEVERLDLLSLFGTWRLDSFWELVVVPVVGWFVRGATNLDAVNDPSHPDAFANGQLILVRRESYERIGGHRAVQGEVLEDVRLAQAFSKQAMRIMLLHAPWAFRARLYRSLGEIVEGYTKNFYEGMGRRPLVALGLALFTIIGSLLPYVIVVAVVAAQFALGWKLLDVYLLAWCCGVCLLMVAFRWRQERADGRTGAYALTHPLGNLVLLWIVVRSMLAIEVRWKGRAYRDGKATDDPGELN